MRTIGKWLVRLPGWVWFVGMVAAFILNVVVRDLLDVEVPLVRFALWLVLVAFAAASVAVVVRYVVRSVRARSLQWISPHHALAVTAAFIGSVVFIAAFAVSDEEQIENAVVRYATGDPDACYELATERYLVQSTGVDAPFADEVCAAYASSSPAQDVAIRRIAIDGDRAEVIGTNVGGSFNGSSLIRELVEEDGVWKLDRVGGFAEFDRARFDSAYHANVLRSGMSEQGVACAMDAVNRLSDPELEREILNPAGGFFARLAVECDRDSVERGLVATLREPNNSSLPNSAVNCAAERIRSASDAELTEMGVIPATFGEPIFECDSEAVLEAFGKSLVEDYGMVPAEAACVVDALRPRSSEEVSLITYDEERYDALIERCE